MLLSAELSLQPPPPFIKDCVYVCVCQVPIEARGVRSLGDGVTGSCEQPDVGCLKSDLGTLVQAYVILTAEP